MRISALLLPLLLIFIGCKFERSNSKPQTPAKPKVEFREPSKIEMQILKRTELSNNFTIKLLFKMLDSGPPDNFFMFDLHYKISEVDNPENILEQSKDRINMGYSDGWFFDEDGSLYITKFFLIDKSVLESGSDKFILNVSLERKGKRFEFEEVLDLNKKILDEELYSQSGAANPYIREAFEEVKANNKFLLIYESNAEVYEKSIRVNFTFMLYPKGNISDYKKDDQSIKLHAVLTENGKSRSKLYSKSYPFTESASFKFSEDIPLMDVTAPPGNNSYDYEIYAFLENGEKQVLDRGKINFTQPQLYGFSFVAEDIDVNVDGMDFAFPIAGVFSNKNRGKGLGDLFIEFRDGFSRKTSERRFAGGVRNNSGVIELEKGSFQFYPDKKISIYFNDDEVAGYETMLNLDVEPLTEGAHEIKFSEGRVNSCHLKYTIAKITKDNFEEFNMIN